MGRLQCRCTYYPYITHIPYADTWTIYRHITHILDLYTWGENRLQGLKTKNVCKHTQNTEYLFLKLLRQPLPELLSEAIYHSTMVVVTFRDQLGYVLSLHDDLVAVVFVFACTKLFLRDQNQIMTKTRTIK